MKKGLFLCSENYSFDDLKSLSIGIAKKIISQVKVFNDNDVNCKLINLHYTSPIKVLLFLQLLFFKKIYISKMIDIDFKNIDFVYIRRFIPLSRSFIHMLKYIKHNNEKCKVICEVPTFPYDSEHTGVKGLFVLWLDKIFRFKLRFYVDYISTYSSDDSIFGLDTINIMNGIDCSEIPVVKSNRYSDTAIYLVAVAQFCEWHGYDRLIEGLNLYYKVKLSRNVFISFIGEGPDLENYKRKVVEYGLSDCVSFHGLLSGEDLDSEFNKADLAVCSLGCHRIGIYKGSFLKSREYMARGLPMISSTKIDILPSDYEYIKYVPEDDSPVDIEDVILFYDELKNKESRENQIKNIRRFAEKNCDIKITMQPILQKIYDAE